MNMLPSVGRSEPLHNRGSKPSDGQIIKGKVIQLLSAEEAIVEINGRAIKASIEVPLKPGSSYLFQVFREHEGFHLKMIKEVETQGLTHQDSVDETIRFLGLPADGRSKTLVRMFFQHDWPIKSALLIQARRLIDLSGKNEDWEALKTLLEKKWPLKESLFNALVAVQKRETTSSLNHLIGELKQLDLTTPAHQQLVTLLENWPGLDEHDAITVLIKGLHTLGQDQEKEHFLMKWLIQTFPDHAETIHEGWPEARILLRKMSTPQELKIFLNLLGLGMSEEQFLTQVKNDAAFSQHLKLSDQQWLKTILEKTGYFYEAELGKWAKGKDIDITTLQHSLKGLLMVLSQQNDHHGDNPFQQSIQHLLQQINGQQLQSLHMDRSFIQLLFTFPLRFQDGMRDVHLFWEGKRKTDGSADSNYCRMAFQLQLPHIDETILHILVQKRRISLSVYNDHPSVEPLIQKYSDDLSAHLKSLGYQLVSVKQLIGSMPEAQAIFHVKAGSMDVKI